MTLSSTTFLPTLPHAAPSGMAAHAGIWAMPSERELPILHKPGASRRALV